jgi:hypothetical protein
MALLVQRLQLLAGTHCYVLLHRDLGWDMLVTYWVTGMERTFSDLSCADPLLCLC